MPAALSQQLLLIPSDPTPLQPGLHPSLFPSLLGSRIAAHHVRPTVSPPPPRELALHASSARKCPSYKQNTCCAQLLSHLKSDVFGSDEPGFKVCGFIEHSGSSTHNIQATRTPLFTTPMEPRADAKLWCAYPCDKDMSKTYMHAADTVVKVPQMAESITEGTLKQWSKRGFQQSLS